MDIATPAAPMERERSTRWFLSACGHPSTRSDASGEPWTGPRRALCSLPASRPQASDAAGKEGLSVVLGRRGGRGAGAGALLASGGRLSALTGAWR